MIYKCPGQDTRNRTVENIICLACGYIAEIFSDEIKVKCPGCGSVVRREKLLSCAGHCRAAKECIGEKKWREIKEG